MSKRIRAKLYTPFKISLKVYRESDPQGFLFSEGKYRTKILPEDLPEWYVHGYLYKQHGYISARDVRHLLYVPNYAFENHLHKDDMLFISYGTKIEPYKTELGSLWYKGYDHVISGSLIERFIAAAKTFSGYDVRDIQKEIKRKQVWYYERNPK